MVIVTSPNSPFWRQRMGQRLLDLAEAGRSGSGRERALPWLGVEVVPCTTEVADQLHVTHRLLELPVLGLVDLREREQHDEEHEQQRDHVGVGQEPPLLARVVVLVRRALRGAPCPRCDAAARAACDWLMPPPRRPAAASPAPRSRRTAPKGEEA